MSDRGTIVLDLIEDADLNIQLFDLTGRQVTQVIPTSQQLAGQHTYTFDATTLRSGVYILVIRVDDRNEKDIRH